MEEIIKKNKVKFKDFQPFVEANVENSKIVIPFENIDLTSIRGASNNDYISFNVLDKTSNKTRSIRVEGKEEVEKVFKQIQINLDYQYSQNIKKVINKESEISR